MEYPMTSPSKSLRLCFALMLATFMPLAWGQQSVALTSNVEQQMSTQEFKAAGLDKLSAQELAALNAWLQQKVAVETSKAVETAVKTAKEEAREEVKQENRGFFDFGSAEPIASNLVGEFKGFAKGKQYTLANGQVWEQTEAATLAGVRKTDPEVTINPGLLNTWYLKIKGYNTTAKVRRIK